MARTSGTNPTNQPFTVLLNKDDVVIAFINPANNVKIEDLVTSLVDKGLKVETRTPDTTTRSTEL